MHNSALSRSLAWNWEWIHTLSRDTFSGSWVVREAHPRMYIYGECIRSDRRWCLSRGPLQWLVTVITWLSVIPWPNSITSVTLFVSTLIKTGLQFSILPLLVDYETLSDLVLPITCHWRVYKYYYLNLINIISPDKIYVR